MGCLCDIPSRVPRTISTGLPNDSVYQPHLLQPASSLVILAKDGSVKAWKAVLLPWQPLSPGGKAPLRTPCRHQGIPGSSDCDTPLASASSQALARARNVCTSTADLPAPPLPLSRPPERRQPDLPSLPSFLPPTITRAAGGHQAQVHKLPWVAVFWVQYFEPYITFLRNFPGPVTWNRPGTSVKNQDSQTAP